MMCLPGIATFTGGKWAGNTNLSSKLSSSVSNEPWGVLDLFWGVVHGLCGWAALFKKWTGLQAGVEQFTGNGLMSTALAVFFIAARENQHYYKFELYISKCHASIELSFYRIWQNDLQFTIYFKASWSWWLLGIICKILLKCAISNWKCFTGLLRNDSRLNSQLEVFWR